MKVSSPSTNAGYALTNVMGWHALSSLKRIGVVDEVVLEAVLQMTFYRRDCTGRYARWHGTVSFSFRYLKPDKAIQQTELYYLLRLDIERNFY